ncbi:WXG100 family type VII secretion target [Nocardia arizonensis]|uniref:WXG100 family type VII secretion target n=1 Tax=Nocardia arizonensis TaxID=1141647 RepID=UPI0006D2C0C2|nr:WXG100 family type VII secretion target [Nocardia arizonensis]
MRYQVDLDHLDDVTTRIGGLNDFLRESLREIDERMAAMQKSWNGNAADKQAEAHREWATAAQEVREGIEAMQAAARTAHTAYNDAVTENLRALGRS